VASLVQVAAVYLAVWSFRGGVSALCLCLAAGYGAGVVLCAGIALRGANLKAGMGRAWEAVRFSSPLYINSLLVFLYQRTDTLLIGGLIGLEGAAILEMVKRLPMVLTRVMGAALTPYLPSMSRHLAVPNLAMAGALAGKAARTVAFLGYCTALSAMVVREPLIRLLFAESYVGGASVLCLLLITAVPALQAGIMTQALIALSRNRMILAVNLCVIAITVLGTVVLAPRWGLTGTGVAALTGNLCSLAAQTFWARRCALPVPWGGAFLPHLAAAPCAALSCLSAGWEMRALAVVLFMAACALLRVVRKEDVVTVWMASGLRFGDR
jgi:O-antigen/teichoic acid export membrane protein